MVLVLRFVPPWTSAFMIERRLAAWRHGETDFHLRYHWVPWSAHQQAGAAGDGRLGRPELPLPPRLRLGARSSKAIDTAEDGGRLRGASTISQQTAKNLFLWGGRSFLRKGLEAYFTVLLEATWPKRRILEVYVNIAELGNGIYGVDAASHAYFHTDPSQLNAHQGAAAGRRAAQPAPPARRPALGLRAAARGLDRAADAANWAAPPTSPRSTRRTRAAHLEPRARRAWQNRRRTDGSPHRALHA